MKPIASFTPSDSSNSHVTLTWFMMSCRCGITHTHTQRPRRNRYRFIDAVYILYFQSELGHVEPTQDDGSATAVFSHPGQREGNHDNKSKLKRDIGKRKCF